MGRKGRRGEYGLWQSFLAGRANILAGFINTLSLPLPHMGLSLSFHAIVGHYWPTLIKGSFSSPPPRPSGGERLPACLPPLHGFLKTTFLRLASPLSSRPNTCNLRWSLQRRSAPPRLGSLLGSSALLGVCGGVLARGTLLGDCEDHLCCPRDEPPCNHTIYANSFSE